MPRLLAAEDEIAILAMVRRVAGLMGFAVDGVTQGRDFQMSYLSNPPDAVIVDMTLPDVAGADLIKWVAGVGPPALTILSADLPRDAFRLLCSKGMPANVRVQPLFKPFKSANLVALLRPLA